MNTVDRDGPPDGDFASYVERLTRHAGGSPGRVGAASGSTSAGPGKADVAGKAEPALKPDARGKPAEGVPVEAARLLAGARASGLRLSRWLTVAGIVLMVVAILELVPPLSPLPGFALLVLSFFLRKVSTR